MSALRSKRGQIFSTDLLLALAIFLFTLTFSIVFSAQLALRVENIESFNHKQDLARSALQGLVLHPGKPANWHKLGSLSTVESIGLANSRNMLAPAKVQGLADLNSSYSTMKTVLGLARYDFEFTLQDFNGTTIAAVGTSPDVNSNTVLVRRLASYNGRNVLARMRVFD